MLEEGRGANTGVLLKDPFLTLKIRFAQWAKVKPPESGLCGLESQLDHHYYATLGKLGFLVWIMDNFCA